MASADKSNRITITFKPERCVHARSTWSDCSLCIDSCPGRCIKHSDNSRTPSLDPARCVQCGQCLSACPLEAFEALDFTERRLLGRISSSEPVIIRCYLPYGELDGLAADDRSYQLGTCMAALTSGALFELALSRSCTLDTRKCRACPILKQCEPTMAANITGAFRMLHGIGKSGNLRENSPLFLPQIKERFESDDKAIHDQAIRTSIHSLFAGIKRKQNTRKVIPLRQQSKHVPSWRVRLKNIWTDQSHVSFGACSFEWPELVVDSEKCVACGLCMQMCPTATITHSFDGDTFTYAFIPGTCANCGLCILICPRSALSREYCTFDSPFEEQIRYECAATECADCKRPAVGVRKGGVCPRCEHERKRIPMAQVVRAHLGIKSPGDIEREAHAVLGEEMIKEEI